MTIPSSTRYLEDVREFITRKVRSADFSESVVEQLKIAVDEACTNVIKHAYDGEGEHVIDIAVIITNEKLVVRIRDRGRSFDPNTYSEPNLIEFAKSRKGAGSVCISSIDSWTGLNIEREATSTNVAWSSIEPTLTESGCGGIGGARKVLGLTCVDRDDSERERNNVHVPKSSLPQFTQESIAVWKALNRFGQIGIREFIP